jgi:hypothetical protein
MRRVGAGEGAVGPNGGHGKGDVVLNFKLFFFIMFCLFLNNSENNKTVISILQLKLSYNIR